MVSGKRARALQKAANLQAPGESRPGCDCFEAAKDFVAHLQCGLYQQRVLNIMPVPSGEESLAKARQIRAFQL